MVKSSRNNGERGPNARLCARDGRDEGGEDYGSFLYCHFITVSSCLEPTVIAPKQCRFLARTGSDMWPLTQCRLQPQTGSDVDLHCRFWPTPNHFLILKPRTGSEGSLSVGRNPAVMRPAVMPDYVVVIVLSAIISELLGLNLREEVSQTMCPCSQVMGKSLLFFGY